jgi:hypothetical protein
MGCANTKVPATEYDHVVVLQEKVLNIIPSPLEGEDSADLSEIHYLMTELKKLREEMKLLTYEKYGVQSALDVCQQKLVELTGDQNTSKSKYQTLLSKVIERDVEEVSRALNSQNVEKGALIQILTARPRWHIALIAEEYQRQFDSPLSLQIREKLTTQFGKLTGSKTGLGKLLEYITTEQPERDGKLLKFAIGDLDLLLEVALLPFFALCLPYVYLCVLNYLFVVSLYVSPFSVSPFFLSLTPPLLRLSQLEPINSSTLL